MHLALRSFPYRGGFLAQRTMRRPSFIGSRTRSLPHCHSAGRRAVAISIRLRRTPARGAPPCYPPSCHPERRPYIPTRAHVGQQQREAREEHPPLPSADTERQRGATRIGSGNTSVFQRRVGSSWCTRSQEAGLASSAAMVPMTTCGRVVMALCSSSSHLTRSYYKSDAENGGGV